MKGFLSYVVILLGFWFAVFVILNTHQKGYDLQKYELETAYWDLKKAVRYVNNSSVDCENLTSLNISNISNNISLIKENADLNVIVSVGDVTLFHVIQDKCQVEQTT